MFDPYHQSLVLLIIAIFSSALSSGRSMAFLLKTKPPLRQQMGIGCFAIACTLIALANGYALERSVHVFLFDFRAALINAATGLGMLVSAHFLFPRKDQRSEKTGKTTQLL